MNSKTGIRDKHPFVYPSRDEAQRYRRELQDAVDAMRERRFPQRGALVWPAGLDRALVAGLPLPQRTDKMLRQAGLMEGAGDVSTRGPQHRPTRRGACLTTHPSEITMQGTAERPINHPLRLRVEESSTTARHNTAGTGTGAER